MKILITGGAGFIGSNFVDYIRTKGIHKIKVADKFTYAAVYDADIVYEDSQIDYFIVDISDYSCVQNMFSNSSFDCVINFAAETHVDRSISMDHQSEFLKTNIMGTHVLLSLAMKHGVKKFIQISTDEVYGSIEDTWSAGFNESSPIQPKNPYSASKASADMLCQSFYNTYGFPVVITRCSNNYGKRQNTEKFIPNMIDHAKNNKPLPVYGRGENIRDWIHVKDHCDAIYRVMMNGRPGEVYNIGSNCEMSNLDIVRTILTCMEKPLDLFEFVDDRPGHDFRYAMDATKIRTELGWKPTVEFDEGIRQLI